MRFFTTVAVLAATCASAAEVTVDFGKTVGKVRPELHSSGYASLMNQPFSAKPNEWIRDMNFKFVRTHDLALINSGARIVDNHFIFPLPHLDATKPENYHFKSTDYFLNLQRKLGLEIFYRLGTSIEHTGLRHFNAEIPADLDKVAENFAATVRHYNRGWANGFEWNIRYWEIWNEPDGHNNMWSFDGKNDADKEIEAKRKALFVELFVKSLKRIKSEFPDVKVGGPALCWANVDYFRTLLEACKAAGVKPDFLSWHYYGRNPDDIVQGAKTIRSLCDGMGLGGIELIIDEWHFLPRGEWAAIRSSDPKVSGPAKHGPMSINGADSAAFSLTTLVKLQHSLYDQAYFYGCRHSGNWGYRDDDGNLNKNFYAMKAFGKLMKYADICEAKSTDGRVTAFPVADAQGGKALLVVDYLGDRKDITVNVAGVDKDAKVSARLVSDGYDLEPYAVSFKNGKLKLVKPDAYSAAFLVTFKK